MIYWPWRAGAEQEGEEEEGHYVFKKTATKLLPKTS